MSLSASHKARSRAASTRARALVFILLVIVLAIIASQDVLHDALLRVLAAVRTVITQHPVVGAALFVLLGALSAMLAFFSSAVLVPVAVYVWGASLCAILLWAGWILGGVCAYAVGRHLGQRVVTRLTSARTLSRYQDKLSNNAPFGLVFLFQLALPSEIPGYVLGMASYPMSRYLLALALAELPYVLGTVFLGEGLVQRRMILLIAVGAASVLLSALAWRALQRRLPSTVS
ncbi:MAG TPA: VTT domain-containing protein [Gemmatimonadaceae bacterium]|nr:VTT domain-containing protein [Gemmatimonadaceae bacterium]